MPGMPCSVADGDRLRPAADDDSACSSGDDCDLAAEEEAAALDSARASAGRGGRVALTVDDAVDDTADCAMDSDAAIGNFAVCSFSRRGCCVGGGAHGGPPSLALASSLGEWAFAATGNGGGSGGDPGLASSIGLISAESPSSTADSVERLLAAERAAGKCDIWQ